MDKSKFQECIDHLLTLPIGEAAGPQICAYMPFVYSLESPIKNERDLSKRKKEALKRANITDPDLQNSLIELSQEEYVSLALAAFIFSSTRKWQLYVAKQELFQQCMRAAITPVAAEDKDRDKTWTTKYANIQKATALSAELEAIEDEDFAAERKIIEKAAKEALTTIAAGGLEAFLKETEKSAITSEEKLTHGERRTAAAARPQPKKKKLKDSEFETND